MNVNRVRSPEDAGLGPVAVLTLGILTFMCSGVADIHLNIMQVRAVDPPGGRYSGKAVAEVHECVDEVPV